MTQVIDFYSREVLINTPAKKPRSLNDIWADLKPITFTGKKDDDQRNALMEELRLVKITEIARITGLLYKRG